MAITKRCRNIILEIIKKESVKQSELARLFKVSERTIRSDLDEINYFLNTNSFTPLYKNKNKEITFKTDENKLQLIYCLINQNDIVKGSYTKEERILELMYLLCQEKHPIKLEIIADRLNVSKSSVVKDLERLKTILNGNVSIIGSSEGIELKGDEIFVRISLINVNFSMMDKKTINDLILFIRNKDTKIAYKVYWHLFENVDLDFISYCIEIMKSRLSMHLSDYSYLYVTATLALLIKRSSYMEETILASKINHKMTNLLIDDIWNIINQKNNIKENEKLFIYYILIFMCKDIYIKENESDFNNYKKISNFICDEMQKKGIYEVEKIRGNVEKEVFSIVVEKKLNQNEYKNIVSLKIDSYFKVMEQVKECWINSDLLPMSEDDYWRIAWHFISVMKKEKNIKKVLIVSDKPKSLIDILIDNLYELFDIELMGITGVAQLEKYLKAYQIDYLISTLNLEGYDNVLKVHPLLQTKEINYLKQYLETHKMKKKEIMSDSNFKNYEIDVQDSDSKELFSLIDKLLQNEKIISHSLSEIMSTNFNKIKNHHFIYNKILYINIREHEIVNRNCIININLKILDNKIFEDVDYIKLIVTRSVSEYIDYVYEFIQ